MNYCRQSRKDKNGKKLKQKNANAKQNPNTYFNHKLKKRF